MEYRIPKSRRRKQAYFRRTKGDQLWAFPRDKETTNLALPASTSNTRCANASSLDAVRSGIAPISALPGFDGGSLRVWA